MELVGTTAGAALLFSHSHLSSVEIANSKSQTRTSLSVEADIIWNPLGEKRHAETASAISEAGRQDDIYLG